MEILLVKWALIQHKDVILQPSYLHNGISYTGKMTSLYWVGALVSPGVLFPRQPLNPWLCITPGHQEGPKLEEKHSRDIGCLPVLELQLLRLLYSM